MAAVLKDENGEQRVVTFPSNSIERKDKEVAGKIQDPKVKPKKVIKGKVSEKKKTFGDKFKETFIGEEVGSVGTYIVEEIIVPAIKHAVIDSVSRGVSMIFGEPYRDRRDYGYGGSTYVSYRGYYSDRDRKDREKRSREPERIRNLDSFVFETRGDAEEVLSQLVDYIADYGAASVGDFYDLIGHTGGSFTDQNLGWTNLSHADVKRDRDGYILDLPRPKSIN